MPIRREFLGWDGPAIERIADWLVGRYCHGGWMDLSRVVVVLPGARAGRALRTALLQRASDRQVGYFLPDITTVGRVPELLYEAKRPLANELVQQLAWYHALRQADAGMLEPLAAHLPAPHEILRWLDLAELLCRQHRELAAERMSFRDVLAFGSQLDGFQEHRRWQALVELQQAYLAILDQLELWDLQTARLVAIERNECHTDKELILAGTADLNRAMRGMLDQVAAQVTVLVLAPSSWQSCFDRHGCLNVVAWQGMSLEVRRDQWVIADGPADEAEAVARWLDELQGAYGPDQITLGIPDPQAVPRIKARLRASGISCRYGPGHAVTRSRPCRALEAVGDYLQLADFPSLAALVRHVDVGRWLVSRGVVRDWERKLDEHYRQHLPAGALAADAVGAERCPKLAKALEWLERLVEPLRGEALPLAEWSEQLGRWLEGLYQGIELDHFHPVARALRLVRDGLEALASIPPSLEPSVSAPQAIRLLLEQLSGGTVPEPPDASALEMLGWLELPMDGAEALVVTGMNEGIVPQAVNGDLFLPDRLRREMGIEDNRRRYARDAYALQMIVHSRKNLRLISSRMDADGNPLLMSRLLAASDPNELARRCLMFCGEGPIEEPTVGAPLAIFTPSSVRLPIPRPQPLEQPVSQLRVTDFRAYLACPYRFYLERILGLSSISDDVVELDRAGFGELAHKVLEQFALSDAADSGSADTITRELDRLLDELVNQRFGKRCLATVAVQREQLRRRLHHFAVEQAKWRNQGWRIQHVETARRDTCAPLLVDDQPIALSGRIDRIDVHEDHGGWTVWDYKTSDSGTQPDKAHRKKDVWVDLQLPLYRHLCRPMGIESQVELGYIVLSQKAEESGFHRAGWTEDELASADEQAMNVVRSIRRGLFWPPSEESLRCDAVGAIFHAGAQDRCWED